MRAASPFVTCFSRSADDLSQWRSYGGGENGYAIGVRARSLLGAHQTLIGNVNYDGDLHTAIAAEIAVATGRLYEKGIQDHERSSPEGAIPVDRCYKLLIIRPTTCCTCLKRFVDHLQSSMNILLDDIMRGQWLGLLSSRNDHSTITGLIKAMESTLSKLGAGTQLPIESADR